MVGEIFEKGRGERASGTHAAKAALPRMLLEGEIFEKGRGERASGTHAAKAALPRMLLEVVSHFVGRFTHKVARWVAATECASRRGFFARLKGRNN